MTEQRISLERESSTPFPQPDRWGEVEQRRTYTHQFSQVGCSMWMPWRIDRVPMPDRPKR